MKPGKTFNLSKQTKRFMATIVDAEQRNAYKRAMIQAQLASEVVVKTRDRNDKRPQGTSSYVTTSNSATPSAE
jgi:hypothetical protein